MGVPVEQQVIALLARHTDLPVERITPDLTLQDGLGLDGDDAAALFATFEAEFRADLASLYETWSDYFNPEGWTLSDGLKALSGVLLIGIPVSLIGAWAGAPEWLAASFAVVAFFIWLGGLRSWPFTRKPLQPITVRELVVTAEAGRWIRALRPA
jgi:acyl carrier protein